MLMSRICAPSSTCLRAIASASSYFFSLINRRNLREPATLHLSPILMRFISGFTSSASSPERRIYVLGAEGRCGCRYLPSVECTRPLYFSMKCSFVPQHPPMILTKPPSTSSFISVAISSGVWSYSPMLLGNPAFGCTLM